MKVLLPTGGQEAIRVFNRNIRRFTVKLKRLTAASRKRLRSEYGTFRKAFPHPFRDVGRQAKLAEMLFRLCVLFAPDDASIIVIVRRNVVEVTISVTEQLELPNPPDPTTAIPAPD